MTKKDKKPEPKKEYIPEGMKREDYADAAFRKKVTIIMGSILLVFVIGVVGVLGYTWWETEQHNKAFEIAEAAFKAETEAVVNALDEIEKKSDNFDDKAQVEIQLTDDNFSDWIAALDSSYQVAKDSEEYARFGGASIHLQGMFLKKEYDGGVVQYWVCRKHSHDEASAHAHEDVDTSGKNDAHLDSAEIVPIEVIFLDPEQKIPEDGTWVDVKGVVGLDSTKNLSAVRYAEIQIMDEAGTEYVK